MELREPFILGKVSVPQPYGLVNVELSCQVARHPSVSKVHKIDVQIFQVLKDFRVFLLNQSLHFVYDFVDTRLQLSIIILNVVN